MWSRIAAASGAIGATCGAVVLFGSWQLANEFEQFQLEMIDWRARASLLVEQHDAHLTALDAVAAAGGTAFEAVAAAIMQSNPRIVAIEAAPVGTTQVLEAAGDSHYSLTIPTATGAVKLQIDARSLLPGVSEGITVGLLLPDGTPIAGSPVTDPDFTAALESDSQPLILTAGFTPALAAILPIWPTIFAIGIALLTYSASILAYRQWRTARSAEAQALYGVRLSRLEHASRVNSLGEMAAGIAHEMTQPLTAILGQSQAGRRLIDRGDIAALEPVLEEIVAQTRRGAAILDRLRQWVRFDVRPDEVVAINEAIANVALLVAKDFEARGVVLSIFSSAPAPTVRGDSIQFEQVLFNLVRNALEAVPSGTGRVTVTAHASGNRAIVEVADNGPGVNHTIRDRLFEPFTTTKDSGMGLGLVLCRRLIERMDGTITLLPDTESGTTFRIILPRAIEKP
jgi:signal transduction histidine kinase